MKSDLVKAATILGISTGLGIIAASIIVVLGIRWAVTSALEPQVTLLRAAITTASDDVGSAVDSAAGTVGGSVTAGADRVSEQVAGSVGSIDRTVARAWSDPMLVAAPQPLPVSVSGQMAIEGMEGGRSIPVDASILSGGNSGDGGGSE